MKTECGLGVKVIEVGGREKMRNKGVRWREIWKQVGRYKIFMYVQS